MDIERVNIVFNYDMPEDSDTYLHRVARAGRFGTKGLAITFVSDETDAKTLNEVQDRFDVNIPELPEEIDISSYSTIFCFYFSILTHFLFVFQLKAVRNSFDIWISYLLNVFTSIHLMLKLSDHLI